MLVQSQVAMRLSHSTQPPRHRSTDLDGRYVRDPWPGRLALHSLRQQRRDQAWTSAAVLSSSRLHPYRSAASGPSQANRHREAYASRRCGCSCTYATDSNVEHASCENRLPIGSLFALVLQAESDAIVV